MRDLLVRQTAAEALQTAKEAAIAAIGLRGKMAQDAMRAQRGETSQRLARIRWEGICRGAWRSRFDAVKEDECQVAQ